MIFEHFALNVSEPHKVKEWYVEHLNMKVVSEMHEPPNMIFLADATGRVVFEFYHNDAAEVLGYAGQHHLSFHVAFESKDSAAEKERLLKAGCTLVEEIKKADGSLLIMLRDPWGLSLQLCQRGDRMNTVDLL